VNVKFYCGVPPTSAGQAPLAHIIDLSRQRLGQKWCLVSTLAAVGCLSKAAFACFTFNLAGAKAHP